MKIEDHWGVKDDSGKWICFRVSEERAREAFNQIYYGKLVKNIRSADRFTVVESNESAHT